MDLFISLSKDRRLKIKDIKGILIQANNSAFKSKIKKSASLSEVKSTIQKTLDPEVTTFDERGDFSEKVITLAVKSMGNARKNQGAHKRIAEIFAEGAIAKDLIKKYSYGSKVSAAGLVRAVSQVMEEPILRGSKNNGDIYAILEVDSKIKPVKDKDHHPSYPEAVMSEGRTTIHLLKERVNWQDVSIDPDTESVVRKSGLVPSTNPKKPGVLVKRSDQILPPPRS